MRRVVRNLGGLLTVLALLAAPRAAARAESHAPAKAADEHAEEGTHAVPHAASLGDYDLRAVHDANGQRSRVRFTLHATASDDVPLAAELKTKKQRVRDQVIVALRLATTSDFEEPTLTRIKRRILARLWRVFPELRINALYMSNFAYQVE